MNDDGSIPISILSTISVSLPLQIVLILVLIALNAFFASAEIALLSFNEAKMNNMADEGNKKAKSVLNLVKDESKFLSTIQVGVTLAGFLSSAFAADSFAELIVHALSGKIHISDGVIQTVSVILITIILSFITLIFGELVPKRYAMKYSDKLAMGAVKPLKFTGVILSPFIFLLTASVNGVLRLIGINPHEESDQVSEEEILYMVNEGQEQGVLDKEEKEMINNILEFDDKTAEEIMTHRTEVVAIPITSDYDEILKIASSNGYSRFPVYEEKLDNIIGTIHIKDLLAHNRTDFNLKSVVRKPCYIPESQKLDEAFKALKASKNHLGIVLDEYGGTAGIITMEDILEELVGNIMDEYDRDEDEETNITKTGEYSYKVDGLTELDEINNELNLELPIEDYDVLSGFIIGYLGYIPELNDNPGFNYKNCEIKVLSHNNKIITKALITIDPNYSEE